MRVSEEVSGALDYRHTHLAEYVLDTYGKPFYRSEVSDTLVRSLCPRILLLVTVLCFSVLATFSAFSPNQFAVNQFVTSTTTSTSMASPVLIFKGPFTVPSTTGTSSLCEFWTVNFTTTIDEHVFVSGNFTSDNPIDFFVVQQAMYQSWLKTATCGTTGEGIASQLTTTSYAFNAAVPGAGTWLIVLVNESNAKNADGYLTAYLTTLGYTVTEVMTSAMTSTTITSTTTSVHPTTSVQFGEVIAIIGFTVGITVGLVAIFLSRKRKEN